jgi:hypothetical protein
MVKPVRFGCERCAVEEGGGNVGGKTSALSVILFQMDKNFSTEYRQAGRTAVKYRSWCIFMDREQRTAHSVSATRG